MTTLAAENARLNCWRVALLAGCAASRRFTDVVHFLTPPKQGNGGLRILRYPNEADAVAEAASLAAGMSLKHRAFNTGFSGCEETHNSQLFALPNRHHRLALRYRRHISIMRRTKLVVSCADPLAVDRVAVMKAVGAVLREHAGALFTGCDLNTTLEDMQRLEARRICCPHAPCHGQSSCGGDAVLCFLPQKRRASRATGSGAACSSSFAQACAPYVLAGLGSAIDPNVATGYGVAGAVAAVAESLFGSLRGRRIFVQASPPCRLSPSSCCRVGCLPPLL